ncbi:sugar ABC transporter permease [Streptomyces bathyalis]|uniref:Sugar ABC transporter permease n=2 Tax=Streptomyces bathyalis TaxID=2710756 RepID=A0A7T1TC81_9ACTN|nr:sugar ABC transporter permease [Streptomyces bathyalis]
MTARRSDTVAGYLFAAPAVLLFLLFFALPLLATIGLSFVHWDLLTPPRAAGLANYERLLGDSHALRVIGNTFVFTFASVVLHLGPGLLMALAVQRRSSRPLKYFLRTAYFFPLLISWAAVALLWQYAMHPTFGVFTHYLGALGVPTTSWLTSPTWSLPALLLVDFWHTIGFTFVILLAGLQAIPVNLYEAAIVDGAGALRRFWNVTLPMLSPTLFFATVVSFIGAFQIFEPMYIMTNGGPGDATRSIVQLLYETAFRSFEVGYASVLALVVFAVIFIVTLLQFRFARRWVHER